LRKLIVTLAGLAAAVLITAPSAGAAVRAYELVSPVDKGGTDASTVGQPFVSPNGEVSVWSALNALPGADPNSNGVLNFYRSVRGPEGWTTTQLGSPLGAVNNLNSVFYTVFSDDLMAGVQSGPLAPPLTPDAAPGVTNLYLNDSAGFHLITKGAEAPGFLNGEALGGSTDLSHVVFSVFGEPLDPESPPVFQLLYEWNTTTETPKIIGRLPDGTPSTETVQLANPPNVFNAEGAVFNPISADASRVFFLTSPEPAALPELYVRIDGSETKWGLGIPPRDA
jgi:hypothetical protein